MEKQPPAADRLAALARKDWDDRARKNASYYIDSVRKDWSPEDFFQSGEDDYQRLVAPVLERVGFDPKGKTALELGAGTGRMTRSLARRFKHVLAVDISAEMLQRGKAALGEFDNVHWVLSNGADLAGMPGESVDFAFSYLVLQHMPMRRAVLRYLAEIVRVLRANGLFLVQFNSSRRPTMNWKGRAAWSLLDLLWLAGLRGMSRLGARVLAEDPDLAGRSWRGASVRAQDVEDRARRSGATEVETTGEGTVRTWCLGRKVGETRARPS